MRFSMVFENQAEGFGSSYDLLFIPCPVWMQGDNLIVDINPETPILRPGSIRKLLEQEEILYVEKCVIVVHEVGHGEISCLGLLTKELEELDIHYTVVDFRELK